MSIEKLEEFAKDGDKNLDNLDVSQGFLQSEKPERQWFNQLLNNLTRKTNEVIDYTDGVVDDVAAQKLDTGITVTAKNGTLPIDQSVKNAQTISMIEYGATGDGAADDTAAFELLESNVTGRVIDLQGKTYLVSKAFNGNDYVNGKLKQASNGIALARGDFKQNYKTSATPINVRAGILKAKLVGNLYSADGAGKGNVVQSICIDDTNGYWYALSAHDTLGSFVNRYKADSYIVRSALDKTDYNAMLGHQGLTTEYRGNDGTDRLWTSLGYEPSPIAGYEGKTASYGVSFVYKSVGSGAISDYEIWKMYDINANASTSPSISVDGRFLIARIQQNDARGEYRIIRVWDMSTIREMRAKGDFDISKLFIAEWTYYPFELGVSSESPSACQAIACDGNYVYILEGHNAMSPARAYVLTFDLVGTHIDTCNINNIGYAEATALNTNGTGLYECEGIQVVSNASGGLSLYIQFAMGIAGARRCMVYALGEKLPTKLVNDDPELKTSLLMGNSQGEDIHFLSTRGFKVAAVGSTGTTSTTKFNLGYDGTVLIGEGVNTQDLYSVVGTGIGGQQNIAIDSSKGSSLNQIRSDNSSAPARHQLVKSRATTHKGSVALIKGDDIGYIDFIGDDGASNWSNGGGTVGARIQARAWGSTIGAGNLQTRLMFSNNSGSNASTPALRWLMETDGALLPIGGMNVGDSSNKVNNLYLTNSPIISSDERLKQDFRSLKAAEKKAALEIKESICLYKMRESVVDKGDGARWHVGVKAQQVVSIMESHKLKPFDYSFICFDEWDAEPEMLDDDGVVIHEAKEAGNQYAIKYDELSMFILAAI